MKKREKKLDYPNNSAMPSSSRNGNYRDNNKNDDLLSTTKDLCKAFDKRFKHFTFTSIPPKLEAWDGSGIVNQVFDEEYNIRQFKSSQEQLTWRIETWIDKCRIQEVDENGAPLNTSSGKFHSAKRFRNKTSNNNNSGNEYGGGGAVNNALTKVRSLSSVSFSLGRVFSKSIENLYRHHDVKLEEINTTDEFQYATETKAAVRIAPSKSTNDLLDVVDNDDGKYEFSSGLSKDDFYHNTTKNNKSIKKRAQREKYRTLELPSRSNYSSSASSPPKNRFNKLLGSVAGKLKPTSSSNNKNNHSNSSNKKNRNSMDADLFLRQRENSESSNDINEQQNNNNNKNKSNKNNEDISGGKKSSRKSFRPSVLEFVRSINSKENRRNRHPTEYEQRPHTIARSTSVAARSTPSPCEYQQQYEQQQTSSQTLFKSRRHNDSVKRFKNKSLGIRPQSAGPFTSSQVFFDPNIDGSPSVRKEMGHV